MTNELITVRQLPIIEEQLQQIKAEVESRVAEALSMVCTEETRVEVKKIRTELKKEFEDLETRRKAVKAAVMAPYEQFEAVYKRCAADLYKEADRQLALRISEVESGIKNQMVEENRAFFEEYRISQDIPADMVTYEQAAIKIGLSSSMKALNTQAVQFLDRIKGDLVLIDTMEHREEILVEYRNVLSVVTAVQKVNRRHAEIERQRQADTERQAAAERRKAAEAEVQRIAEEDAAPTPPAVMTTPVAEAVPEQEETKVLCRFEITDTIPRLRALKEFLTNGGYEYVNT